MAVDHAQRARWVSRVLRLRQAGLQLGLEDIQTTAADLRQGGPMEGEPHQIGGEGHPLTGLVRSFHDLEGDDTYVGKLFDMDIDALIKEWRDETAAAHEQMVSHVDQLKPGTIAMSQREVDECYSSQDEDEALYVQQAEEKLDTGNWPVPHRLGHGYAMAQEDPRDG